MLLLPFSIAVVFLFFIQALFGRATLLCPDLGPILAVYLGLFGRREWVSVGAGILGLLRASLDLEPVAATVLIYLCVAHAVAVIRRSVFAERVATQLVVSFAGGALYLVLHSVAAIFFPALGAGGAGGLLRVTVATLSATVVAPGLFALLRVLRVGP